MTAWRRLDERLRMGLVAVLGASIGWVTYELIHWANPLEAARATTSWLLAFAIGVVRQHWLHRRLTFDRRGEYGASLGRAYVYYGSVAALGAATNLALVGPLGLHHRGAWLLCLCVTAACGLFFLPRYVFKASDAIDVTDGRIAPARCGDVLPPRAREPCV